MKKISLLILTVCSMFAFGQKLADYKYISVPVKFETFNDDFGLGELLIKNLRAKNYTIVPTDKLQWPSDAQSNPCSVLMADIINDSGFLRNKVVVQFKDCNDKAVSSIKGASSVKDFKEGFQDALKQTYVSISPANPTNQLQNKIQETTTTNTQVITNTVSMSTDSGAQKFSNGKMDLQRIQIDNGQFILVNSNSTSPFATFKATTKNDVFRVKLQNGESTLGYFENGNIVIEIPQGNGEYSKEVFSKK